MDEAGDVSGFFTKRNLWASALIVDGLKQIDDKECSSYLMFTFTATLMNISKKAQHLEKGGGYIPGNYTFPPMIKERNALASYQSLAKKVIKGVEYINNNYKAQNVIISTQSALDLSNIPSTSIDYIFTDPPYSNKVPFGEFNFLWEVWLNKGLSWQQDEVIVNEKIGRGYDYWKDMMVLFLEECYRVLKPGRWMSVCYHDSDEGSWGLLQNAFNEVGFIPDGIGKVLSIERDLKSFKQRTTSNVQMRDLVINYRKPLSKENLSYLDMTITENDKGESFRIKALSIIRGYLERHPGSTRDQIYDQVVSRMVRLGKMEAHNFDEILKIVAAPEGENNNQWFLKEEDTKLDDAESIKEDHSAEKIATYIKIKTKENPETEGVHYSDIFEFYIYNVEDKPRRQLLDWINDYFYITQSGNYRLPSSKVEEQLKIENRLKGTNRRIKRYISYLKEGVPVPKKEIANMIGFNQ